MAQRGPFIPSLPHTHKIYFPTWPEISQLECHFFGVGATGPSRGCVIKDDGNSTPGVVQLGGPEVACESLSCGSHAYSFLPAHDSASTLPTLWGWDAGKPGQEGQRSLPYLGSQAPSRQRGQPCCCLDG